MLPSTLTPSGTSGTRSCVTIPPNQSAAIERHLAVFFSQICPYVHLLANDIDGGHDSVLPESIVCSRP